MKTKTILALATLTLLNFANAGERGGNGGDAIVCPRETVLLDYVEMNQRGMTLDLPAGTIADKVAALVKRVKRIDLDRTELLERTAKLLVDDIEKWESGGRDRLENVRFTRDELSDVPDSLEISIPEGCVRKQLVIQTKPVFPQDRRFTIDEKIWRTMNTDQKALTVMHEAWYTNTLEMGATNSRFARYMNGIFASVEFSSPSFSNYLELFDKFSTKMGTPLKSNYYYVRLAQLSFLISTDTKIGSLQKMPTEPYGVSPVTRGYATVEFYGASVYKKLTSLELSLDGKIVSATTNDLILKKTLQIENITVSTNGSFVMSSTYGLNGKLEKIQMSSASSLYVDGKPVATLTGIQRHFGTMLVIEVTFNDDGRLSYSYKKIKR